MLLQRALQRADKLLNGSEIRAEMADSLSAEELTRAVEQQEGQQVGTVAGNTFVQFRSDTATSLLQGGIAYTLHPAKYFVHFCRPLSLIEARAGQVG